MAAQLEVVNTTGQSAGSVEVPGHLFASDVSDYALYRAVVTYETNQRQGNASTKTRAEIARTSKKHHRQKGTGGARRGSLRSPIVRGGGVAFGPRPRDYELRMPKALKRRAFASALSQKHAEGQVKVIDDFDFPEPSTKSFVAVLKACDLEAVKVLFVLSENSSVLYKSCRNIPAVSMRTVGTLGAYDVVRADIVVFTRKAVEGLGAASQGSDES
jgi:large subunit ribosomal protein L4